MLGLKPGMQYRHDLQAGRQYVSVRCDAHGVADPGVTKNRGQLCPCPPDTVELLEIGLTVAEDLQTCSKITLESDPLPERRVRWRLPRAGRSSRGRGCRLAAGTTRCCGA